MKKNYGIQEALKALNEENDMNANEFEVEGWNSSLTLDDIKNYGDPDDDNNWYGNPVVPIVDILDEVGREISGVDDDLVWDTCLGHGAGDADVLVGTGKYLKYDDEYEFMNNLVREVDFIKLEKDASYRNEIKNKIKEFVSSNLKDFE